MHRPIFGHSFAVLVAPILLSVLAFNFLNKKKASGRRNEEDADTGAPGSLTAPAEADAGGSSSSPTGNCYEVFLSFRGADTRKGFTDHLYKALLNAGIDTFRDNDELCQGQNIRPVLMEAITNSKVLIPIFSESYGTSGWCLDELVQIMERKNNEGQIVLPIFYKVKPSDVGHQIGRFGKLFLEREKRLRKRGFDPTTLENWKKALLEVSTLSGYEANGYEADLVKSIVRKVLSELKKKFELDISENLVGIGRHVKEVMEFVDNKSHATLFVGIHGMGGIGKTTLAKAIYNELSNQFEHRSFIADIRESWKRNGAHYLQNKLICHILKRENEVDNEDEGIKFISSKFRRKKVLVLLDDVDDVIQVKRLAGNHDWFSSGSKIIITTRNKKILTQVGVDYTYDHKEMDNDEALILFSKHAFRRDFPPREFKNLAHKVVSKTGGLPLSLEVLGSLLCGEKKAFWRGTIDKLKKVPPKKVQETLRISYEVLENGQKEIFLDIACFFIGTDRRIASYMWDACCFFPEEGIEVLRFMSLIKIGDDHELRMHDQLRDLGREIVREENRKPENRSRLWDYEEVHKVLKLNKGTDKIEAIDLSKGSSDGYTDKQFKKLTSLRFLHMREGAHLSGDFEGLMDELKWLRWERCSMNFEADNFHPIELAVLELQFGAINERWQGWSYFKMAENLKFLDLSLCRSLENTDFLSAFKKLEVLILNHCERLQQIDSSIGDMKALLRLDLRHCWSLTELPEEIGKLKALKQLILYGTGLSALPDSIGSLQNLKILDISYSGIKELPNDIGRLGKLRELRASHCENMKGKMPESMGSLKNLEILDISSRGISELPESMGSLKNLEILDISSSGIRELPIGGLRGLRKLKASCCFKMKGKMPESIGSLENLEILDISESGISELPNSIGGLIRLRELKALDCENLKGKMPESICNLSSLQRFDVCGCEELQSLPDLPSSLTYLGVTCQSCILPSLSHLTRLKELRVTDCPFLECIPEFPPALLKNSECSQPTDVEESELAQSLNTPFKLELLEVTECESIEILDVSQLIHLRILSTLACDNLLEVRGLDRLKYLERLTITSRNSRLDLPPQSEGLKKLVVHDCENLVEIQGLDRLVFLEELSISDCASIERLLLPKSESLKKLEAKSCMNLAEIHGLGRLELLETLDLTGCASIKSLPILCCFDTLRTLRINRCDNLQDIQSLKRFPSCKSLWIEDCKSLAELPNLSSFHNLQKLFLSNCHELREIPGLEESISLEYIAISGCSSIEILPDLSSCTRLRSLIVQNCERLTELRGLEKLEQLVELDISGCKSLKTIPELSGTQLYQNYKIKPFGIFPGCIEF